MFSFLQDNINLLFLCEYFDSMEAEIHNLLKCFHFQYLESNIINSIDTNRGPELTLDTGCQAAYPWLLQASSPDPTVDYLRISRALVMTLTQFQKPRCGGSF